MNKYPLPVDPAIKDRLTAVVALVLGLGLLNLSVTSVSTGAWLGYGLLGLCCLVTSIAFALAPWAGSDVDMFSGGD